MKTYTKADLIFALRKLGICEGDVIYVSCSLFQLGRVDGIANKEQLCQMVYDALISVIGNGGTIVVPTFTTFLGRSGEAFFLETTPTDTGIFSEYIRQREDSIRSLHPLHSVAATGAKSREICEKISPNSYSIASPSYRLYQIGAKAITLGAKRAYSGWVHLLEAMHGLPYIYNKLLDIDVYAKDQKVKCDFFAPVRYLDFNIEYDIIRAENIISDSGIVTYEGVGSGQISCILSKDYFELGNRLLIENPNFFLKQKPDFRHGEIPFDGITGLREPDK